MGKNISKYFLFIMSFIFLGYLIYAYISERDIRRTITSEEESVSGCTSNDFNVEDLKWHKEDKDASGIIDSITITNRGDYDCKDIRGIVRFLSDDRTEIGKIDFVIYEEIRSKETKTFNNIPIRPILSSNMYNASVTIVGATVYPEKAN